MEALGAFSDGEWDSFTAMFSSLQELDQSPIMANNPNSTELQFPSNNGGSELHNNNSWFYSLDAFDPNLQSSPVKQDMSCSSCSTDNSSGSFLFANSSDLFVPIDERNFGSSLFSDVLMEELDMDLAAAGQDCSCQRFVENVLHGSQPLPQLVDSGDGGSERITLTRKVNNKEFSDNQKKKTQTRVAGDGQKNKKTQQGKKSKKRRGENVEEEGQSFISYSSEEDNGSEEGLGGSATTSDCSGLNGKGRASRGSATDPQSLYARKRRERINERLKILQKLVPNGTKVDISTMLEEAVHYVKFLQLQIKLLSSDDMWMFAPLAYNGMDLGLHHKLSPFLSH